MVEPDGAGKRALWSSLQILPVLFLGTVFGCLWGPPCPPTSISRPYGLSKAPPVLPSCSMGPYLVMAIGSW